MVLLPSKSRVPFLISLFNFQGPLLSRFFRDSLKSISHSFYLVNTFLKLFSFSFSINFFVLSLESSSILSPFSVFVNSFLHFYLFILPYFCSFYTPFRVFLGAWSLFILYLVPFAYLMYFILHIVNKTASCKKQETVLLSFILYITN